MRVLARSMIGWLAIASLTACAGGPRTPPAGPGGPVASAAVERFLDLAMERSYLEMGWVFGTKDGPVIRQWPASEVEKRMYALASVLRHESYVLGRENPVPGRTGSAMRFDTRIINEGRSFEVPFVTVRGPDGRWYVEQVDVAAVTNMR